MAADSLPARFIATAKRRWSALAIADSTGRELTYGRTLIAALLLARAIRRQVPEDTVGLLLPASAGGAIANVAASLAGKIPVNLNFTAGAEAMAAAVRRCRIGRIVTSRTFLEKASIAATGDMLFLEDLLRFGPVSKVVVAAAARLLSAPLLTQLMVPARAPDSVATIIFSSGSTSVPKGVMLTHRNISANIESVNEAFELTAADVMLGVLPFFHSFGFTGTLWFPLLTGFAVVYHPNPTDAKSIGDLSERYGATLIISTPTFCASYTRKIRREQFAALRYAIVGAEKLREPIARAFKDKFGLDLLEGYGCTEMAPIVSVNLPGTDRRGTARHKPGTVGRPLPRVEARIVDPEALDHPLPNGEGMLLLKGPNRMLGYLDDPAATAAAFRGEWYVTGDIASIDGDEFIRITDRLSRFSKIGGEMVPHMRVEEELQRLLPEPHTCFVTSVPCDVKGERLVAFFTDPDARAQDLWDRLGESELPKLWIPKRDDMRFVDAIPTLGTGKIDQRAVRELALTIPRRAAASAAMPAQPLLSE